MKNMDKELLESEWAILRVVWEKEPCTAPEVQETLVESKGWAYTTVKTIMDRMVKKGLLATEKLRNLYLYRAAITQPQAQHNEILQTVKRAFNGALTPMMHFLIENETLSNEEYHELEQILKRKKRERSSK